MSVIAETRRAP